MSHITLIPGREYVVALPYVDTWPERVTRSIREALEHNGAIVNEIVGVQGLATMVVVDVTAERDEDAEALLDRLDVQ